MGMSLGLYQQLGQRQKRSNCIIQYAPSCAKRPVPGPRLLAHHSILCLFSSLSPQLHHEVNKAVEAKDKADDDTYVPPPVVLFLQVQRDKVVTALRVLAHLAAGRVAGVEQIRSGPHALLVSLQILSAGLIRCRIEDGELVLLAINGLIPGGKDQQCTHEVVERVDVVEPVSHQDEDAVRGYLEGQTPTNISRMLQFGCMGS